LEFEARLTLPNYFELKELEKISKNRHGNAYYADKIRENFHFRTERHSERVLEYKNGVYEYGGETTIKEECEKIIPECSTHKVKEVINIIRRGTYIPKDQGFGDYKNLLNLKNGILDLDNGNFMKHSPKYFFRIQFPVKYDQSATAEQFMKFLEQCLPDEKNRTKAIESFAATLLANKKLEKMFMHTGVGSNGKSTFLYVQEEFLGGNNVSNISIHDLLHNRFAKSGLDGKLANIYADISRTEIKELGPVKAIISGDSIEVERKNQTAFKMRNMAKLIYSCNELPELGEDTIAVYRRLMLIEWNQIFISDGPNPVNDELNKELTTESELSGILNLLIPVAQRLMKNGRLSFEENIEELRTKWGEKSDPIGKFLETCLEQDNVTMTSKADMYEAFRQWCLRNNNTPKTQRDFNAKLSEYFIISGSNRRINGKSTRVWDGIRIIPVTNVTAVTA